MKFDKLVERLGGQPFFDLATVRQLSGEPRERLRTQLHRWVRARKLLPLRRGLYSLTDHYRRVAVNPAELANQLYRPSYLSGHWALGFYGLIPEGVVTYTSVTTRVPRTFDNAFGQFEYRHVKAVAFFGYRMVSIQGQNVTLADPEKAILDLWHLGKGKWTEDRMREMRFQNRDAIDPTRLEAYAARYESPRLLAAVGTWLAQAAEELEGTVAL